MEIDKKVNKLINDMVFFIIGYLDSHVLFNKGHFPR